MPTPAQLVIDAAALSTGRFGEDSRQRHLDDADQDLTRSSRSQDLLHSNSKGKDSKSASFAWSVPLRPA